MDAAISQGAIPRGLAFVRREVVAAMGVEAVSRQAGLDAIASRLNGFYASRAGTDQALVKRAIAGAQDVWARNVSAMNVKWGTHPSHLGHIDSNGCFRCHDDSHKASDGSTIDRSASCATPFPSRRDPHVRLMLAGLPSRLIALALAPAPVQTAPAGPAQAKPAAPPAQKPAASPTQKPGAPAATFVGADTCLACHEGMNKAIEGTPHGRTALPRSPAATQGCESCHGPGSRHIEDPSDNTSIRKFAKMAPRAAAEACQTCHANSATPRWDGASTTRGTCRVSCHSVHTPKSPHAQLGGHADRAVQHLPPRAGEQDQARVACRSPKARWSAAAATRWLHQREAVEGGHWISRLRRATPRSAGRSSSSTPRAARAC